MNARSHEQTSPTWYTLRRDKTFWVASTLFTIALVPYVLPGLPADRLIVWVDDYADVFVQGAVLVALLGGITRVRSERERRFWAWAGFAVAALFLGECVSAFVPLSMASPVSEISIQTIYLCFYLGMALALETSRPRGEEEGVGRLIWLRIIGLMVLLLGLLMYFVTLPTILGATIEMAWAPSLFIYGALDIILCIGFIRARHRLTDRRWRAILGGVAVIMACNAILDTGEAVLNLESFASMELSVFLELPWYVPPALLLILARFFRSMPRAGLDPRIVASRKTLHEGPLLAYLLVLPLLHVALYATGLLEASFRGPRDVLVGLVLLPMGILTFLYQWTVGRQNEEAHRELSISRERYQSFLRTSGEGIYRGELARPVSIDVPVEQQVTEIRGQLRISEANDALAQMHGYDRPSEIVGMLFTELMGERELAAIGHEFIASGYEAIGIESTAGDNDGAGRFFRNSVSGVIENGLLVRIWGTQVDVTEQRLRDKENELLEKELLQSQKMETMGTLAGGIAHEFNNILAPIMGFVDLAVGKIPPDNTVVRSYLAHAGNAAQRAKDLINQILTVSRKQDVRKAPVLVQDIVAEALALIRPTFPSTIDIELNINQECPPVMANAGQIHQVLMGLCTNAHQAIGDSVGHLIIRLRWMPVESAARAAALGPGGQVVLTVSDDGPGMLSDVASRIFEPFFTTKDTGEGTGLGLSVAHGIVTGHGGELIVDTAPGQGATFVVYLPAMKTGREPSNADDASTSFRGSDAGRALLVDDDAAVAAVAEAMLTRIGFDVTTLVDSELALVTLRANPQQFDLLFTDHTMPRLTGTELAAVAHHLNPGMAIVITSGYRLADAPIASTGFELLSKPFDGAGIAAAVERARARTQTVT